MSINTNYVSARVYDVLKTGEESYEVHFFIEDRSFSTPVRDDVPRPGDIFLVQNFDTGAECTPILETRIGRASENGWHPECDGLRWRRLTPSGRSRMSTLRLRHAIRRSIRDFLDSAGFTEFDIPLLVRGTTPDSEIDSFCVDDRYLSTSTEYQLKRLEVGGFDKVYSLTSNFRLADGEGNTRNPEFTMLEWARVGSALNVIQGDVEEFTKRACRDVLGKYIIEFSNTTVNLEPRWRSMAVSEAIEKAYHTALPNFQAESFVRVLERKRIELKPDWRNDAPFLFSILMADLQPCLGIQEPVFLTEWPAFETSSAAVGINGTSADRAELFIAGVELADGFSSMINPEQQLLSFEDQLNRRTETGKPGVNLDTRYLDALQTGMPAGAGMALGFDRLVMLLTNTTTISDVLTFSWDEA